MTLEILQKAMIEAMRNHEKARKETISSLVSAVKKAAIDKKCRENITEELVNEVILKEKKIVNEMISTCPDTRPDLLREYTFKLEVIDEFVPKMMSEDEVRKAIYHIIATTDIQYTGKGAIMKTVMPRLKGKADGKLINKIVTEICEKTGE